MLQMFYKIYDLADSIFHKKGRRGSPPSSALSITHLSQGGLGFKEKDSVKGRTSHLYVFFKKGVPKGFTIYTGKYLCWNLF